MIVIKLGAIYRDSGNCFVSQLDGVLYPGEGSRQNRTSSLILFENGVALGPSSARHDLVREIGQGAYSHWGHRLYFSSSDNSDPSRNGREYLVSMPSTMEEEESNGLHIAVTQASNPAFLRALLTGQISTQGSELHSVYVFRSLLMYGNLSGVNIEGSNVLEIGASPTSGLAICLGLAGARHVVVNNILPIFPDIDADFARNLCLLSALVNPQRRTLEEVVDFSSDGKSCRLKPSLFTVLGNTDAESIPEHLPERINSVDLIFSASVLEHIRHLPDVLRSLRNIASSKTVAIHIIDARDHTDFGNPLKYLYFSDEVFDAAYGEEHNRWRFPDYLTMMNDAGWQVDQALYRSGIPPVLSDGRTDMYQAACEGPESILKRCPFDLGLRVACEDIRKINPSFSRFTPEELSILVFCLICRTA